METKNIKYKCKFCKYEWELNFPMAVMPSIEVKCPNCNKMGNHQKPPNFFKDNDRNI